MLIAYFYCLITARATRLDLAPSGVTGLFVG
jgi:hypothetical protein